MAIPYATVEDVESRLGYELDLEESNQLEAFLTDFSLIIESAYAVKGKDPASTDSRLLQLVVARRGVDYILTADLLPGQTAFSETVADRSISGSVSTSAAFASTMSLTKEEKRILGLGRSSSIYSIQMQTREEAWRKNGNL